MKLLDSSKMTLILFRSAGFSISRSTARRRPNSTSSNFCNEVSACCISVMVAIDSS